MCFSDAGGGQPEFIAISSAIMSSHPSSVHISPPLITLTQFDEVDRAADPASAAFAFVDVSSVV